MNRDVRSEFEQRPGNQLIDFAGLLLHQRRGTGNAYKPNSTPMPMRRRLEEATVESTFDIFKVTPDGPLTQMCTMKCPRCGSTASKEKPEERFKCEQCGWKL
jgi:ribosomal protein S27AE